MFIKPVYPHRFHPEYLSKLAEVLDLENLKMTAIEEKGEINKITDYKCINIDFCGIASTNLFGTELGRPEINKECIEERRNLAITFKKLFNKSELKKLNDDGYLLKVRFCFSYLFADFPICLMKAEQPNIWTNIGDKPIDGFYNNWPLTFNEYDNSEIRIAQQQSLKMIENILSNNPDVIIRGGTEKTLNTIQLRFNVIPSPVCVLIINDKVAFLDPYMYSKSQREGPLSLTFPVIGLSRVDVDGKTSESYLRVRRHFNYLWKHDLTLFCSDATDFTPNNITGVTSVLSPEDVIARNWTHKEKRIRAKLDGMSTVEFKKYTNQNIDDWKNNLNKKFMMCTRKIENISASSSFYKTYHGNDKSSTEGNQIKASIGAKKKCYYLHIQFGSSEFECEWLSGKSNLLFCVVAHYSYALVGIEKSEPVLHKILKTKNQLKERLIDSLESSDLSKSRNGSAMFDLLFDQEMNFKVLPQNIKFDFAAKAIIATASYSHGFSQKEMKLRKIEGPMIGCLEYPTHCDD